MAGKKKKKKNGIAGQIITGLFVIMELFFMGLLMVSKMVPGIYLGIIVGILAVLAILVAVLVWKTYYRVRFAIGTFLAAALTAVLVAGDFYLYQTTDLLADIAGTDTEITQMGIYVNMDDTAASLSDTVGYTYGILSTLDSESTQKTVGILQNEMGIQLQTATYGGLTELVDGLISHETGAIILNQAYLDVIQEVEGYEQIRSSIRLLDTKQVETEIAAADDKTQNSHVYTIYISGIDTRGGITAKSRSDVNILAVVNTDTRQVLLLSTPRDYYVPLSISGGEPDKLTHAGIYGVDVCMDTLEMLYGVDIPYYFRLNFDGFVKIINALGGITVYSDYEFDSQNELGYHFYQGANDMNGEAALVFARERFSFAEGDRQRGKNQMAVIQGVLNKVMSPEILRSYTSVLDGLRGCFETNFSYDEIARLIQQQLSDGRDWNIVSYSVNGTGDIRKPYSMSQNAYVMVPDYSTVDTAKNLIYQVISGNVCTPPQSE